jgi:hypothetical protein
VNRSMGQIRVVRKDACPDRNLRGVAYYAVVRGIHIFFTLYRVVQKRHSLFFGTK